MKHNFIITKCINIKEINSGIYQFEFDKEVLFESNYVHITSNSNRRILSKNLTSVYPELFTDAQELFLNKFVLIVPADYEYIDNIYQMLVAKHPTKEQLWNYLGNLQNAIIEEIDLIQFLLNE